MLNFRHVSGCIELNGASQVLKVKQMMKCFVWLALQSTVPQEPLRLQPAHSYPRAAALAALGGQGTAAARGGSRSTRLWVLPELLGEYLFSY